MTITIQPGNGTVTVNVDGSIAYVPGTDYVGVDAFQYQVCDDGTPLPAFESLDGNPLARDGVSCTVCHQTRPDNLGKPESFSARLEIRNDQKIYGPFKDPAAMFMGGEDQLTDGFKAILTEFFPQLVGGLAQPAYPDHIRGVRIWPL